MTKAEPPGNSGGGFREGDRDYDSRLRFGAFVLDLQKRKLYSIDGNRIRLSPKPFDTLAFLAENPGKIIEKQTLLDAVWRNSFVTEDTMVKAVGEIRRVLGDDKDDPQFIQTIPGEGYRFVAEVIRKSGPEFSSRTDGISGSAVTAGVIPPANSLEEAGTARTQDQTVAVKMHSKTSSRHILLTLSSIALCLVILASVIWWHPSKSTASPTQRLISTFPGAHSEASLSPDAGWIAFTRPDAKGEFQIWIKNLAQGDPQQVTFEGGSRPR